MKRVILIFIIISGSLLAWENDNLGRNLSLELSGGLQFWSDHLNVRNIQLSTIANLGPGWKFYQALRINENPNFITWQKNKKPFYDQISPLFDEIYLEYTGYSQSQNFRFDFSLKSGLIRYLRFPYYRPIDLYQRVTGLSDLRGAYPSCYHGDLLSCELKVFDNLFLHSSLINWHYLDGVHQGQAILEFYLGYHQKIGKVIINGRYGILQEEKYPVGYSDLGGQIYLGYDFKYFSSGILFSKIADEIRTGFNLKFEMHKFSQLFGAVRLDYTRAEQGFVLQLPLYDQVWQEQVDITDKKLVGTIYSEQVITFWGMGMMRNRYEHVVKRRGITSGKDLLIVKKHGPWYLSNESIFSTIYKISSWADFRSWDKQGQRPGQYSRKVVYQYYR
ncbi:MAG: hypothetical protein R6U84_07050 [Candidatus Cloacimonadales bacterium]